MKPIFALSIKILVIFIIIFAFFFIRVYFSNSSQLEKFGYYPVVNNDFSQSGSRIIGQSLILTLFYVFYLFIGFLPTILMYYLAYIYFLLNRKVFLPWVFCLIILSIICSVPGSVSVVTFLLSPAEQWFDLLGFSIIITPSIFLINIFLLTRFRNKAFKFFSKDKF